MNRYFSMSDRITFTRINGRIIGLGKSGVTIEEFVEHCEKLKSANMRTVRNRETEQN